MKNQKNNIPIVLTIAGTDPSGGAGINVDLQVFRDHGCHGVAAITAVVWQNTRRVGGWRATRAADLRAQLDLIVEDFDLSAIKIGMLPTAELMNEVSNFLSDTDPEIAVVFDPVMAGGNGDQELMTAGGKNGLVAMIERVDLITPNGPEAESIAVCGELNGAPEELLEGVLACGWRRVLLKGGHLHRENGAPIVDWYGDECGVRPLPAVEPVAADVRGTGCQLSSSIAAERALGRGWEEAVANARNYLHRRLVEDAQVIGGGRPIVVRAESVS